MREMAESLFIILAMIFCIVAPFLIGLGGLIYLADRGACHQAHTITGLPTAYSSWGDECYIKTPSGWIPLENYSQTNVQLKSTP